MTVIVLTNCPVGLRGFLTRWLLEISPGVFLGAPSTRIRDLLWAEVREYAGQGRALLAYRTDNEQGYAFETHDHAWHPADHDGLTLIHRPAARPARATSTAPTAGPEPEVPRQGWSKASKRRRFGGGR
ncbi:type I-E CRISPR-associated endoribonuclease Cas2e [Streptomyces californicus]|uniref:type I-E CRISPR-associated endoribonuclease Cas2e n=1 Tax=Streptomyces californicus TaxID=67351 RepID=UPI0036CFCBE8